MLGSKSKSKPTGSTSTQDSGSDTCVVTKGASIEGKFTSSDNVRFDGKMKGEFSCTNRLVMGESASIEGNVMAQDAIIMGSIKGEVIVKGSLHLKSTAFIEGNIQAKTMIVDEGARYVGECKIGG
ncbi:MAG: hypothetical protein Kow0027_18150 [Saprospiraceae bacterium]|jgi:cytoskeletal protein CcmA (bactofilin family)|nr:cell shape determination protein CcmA [Saprospirales bacterium]